MIDTTKSITNDNNAAIVRKMNVATLYRTTNGKIFNELEQDLLDFVISKIDRFDEKKGFDSITFEIPQFFDKTNRVYRRYTESFEALLILQSTQIIINDVTFTSWLSSVTRIENSGIVTVNIDPSIKQFLGHCHSNYVEYESENVFKLNSMYSKKFYPILKAKLMYLKSLSEKRGEEKEEFETEFTLKELKELFSIATDKYQKYNNFKKRVILYMQNDINTFTDIEFDFKEKKIGHSVYKLILTIKSNVKNEHKDKSQLNPNQKIVVELDKAGIKDTLKKQIIGLKTKKEEPKKQDSGFSYQKEKDFQQKNKTTRVDEMPRIPVVDEIPDKTEFDEQLDINFKEKIEKQLDSSMINILIDDNEIHFYLDTKNSRVKVYFPISVMQYFIDNKIERRLNNLLLVADIIQKPFDTDGVQKLFYKVTLIGVKQ